MSAPETEKPRVCARPGCVQPVKPGVLACKPDWYALSMRLRDKLVFAWEQRKANPDVPELITIHRALLVEALREWGLTDAQMQMAMRSAPSAVQTSCPFCGAGRGLHRPGCQRLNN